MAKGLWNIPDIENLDVRLPVSILKEQASALTEETKGLLIGEIRTLGRNNSGEIRYTLDITVPTLNNYRYSILQVVQPVKIYPITIYASSENETYPSISNDQEFVQTLQKILGSDETGRILSALLAQAQDSSSG